MPLDFLSSVKRDPELKIVEAQQGQRKRTDLQGELISCIVIGHAILAYKPVQTEAQLKSVDRNEEPQQGERELGGAHLVKEGHQDWLDVEHEAKGAQSTAECVCSQT